MMGKGGAGCLTLIVGVIALAIIYEIIKWSIFNVLGLIGIIIAIVGIVLMINRKRTGFKLYWPIAAIINGLVLTFSWFLFQEWLNALGFFSLLLFCYFLITSIALFVKKQKGWKQFSGLTVALFILAMIFMVNAPRIETTQSTAKSKIDPAQSASEKIAGAAAKQKHKAANTTGKTADQSADQANNTVADGTAPPQQANAAPSQDTGITNNPNLIPVTLAGTVDGDTIKVNYNGKVETVRYLLIDTPEEKKPGECVEKYAVDAYNRNKQLLNSGNLALEFEKENQRDKYGRLLAYVFVNGASVEETLLKEGYARVAYIYDPPYKYLDQYESDENIAKNQNLRIWSLPGFVTDRGFNGCADPAAKTSSQQSTAPSTSAASGATEFFANCTELRKKYPNGVPKGSPAYQDKLDKDKDGYACEPY